MCSKFLFEVQKRNIGTDYNEFKKNIGIEATVAT